MFDNWKLKVIVAAVILGAFGFYTYKVAFINHKSGKEEIRAEWREADRQREAMAELARAKQQKRVDENSAHGSQVFIDLQKQASSIDKDLENEKQSNTGNPGNYRSCIISARGVQNLNAALRPPVRDDKSGATVETIRGKSGVVSGPITCGDLYDLAIENGRRLNRVNVFHDSAIKDLETFGH